MRHRAAAFFSRLPGLLPLLLAAASTAGLSACGFKGPLVLPPGPAPAPVFGYPAPKVVPPAAPATKPTAKPAAKPATPANPDNDTSTDKDAARP